MLNPTSTCGNRGITRIFEGVGDIAQPYETCCGKWFAGKMRAKIVEKSAF